MDILQRAEAHARLNHERKILINQNVSSINCGPIFRNNARDANLSRLQNLSSIKHGPRRLIGYILGELPVKVDVAHVRFRDQFTQIEKVRHVDGLRVEES